MVNRTVRRDNPSEHLAVRHLVEVPSDGCHARGTVLVVGVPLLYATPLAWSLLRRLDLGGPSSQVASSDGGPQLVVLAGKGPDNDDLVDVAVGLGEEHPKATVVVLSEKTGPRALKSPTTPGGPWFVSLHDSMRDVLAPYEEVGGERKANTLHNSIPRRDAARRALSASKTEDERALLSPREREVLELFAGGADQAEIADELGIAKDTVRSHLSNIMAKLGVVNRVALLARSSEMRTGRVERSALR